MASKYDQLAKDVVELVGGKENIKEVRHCITRVRFVLKDDTIPDTEAISKLQYVIQVINANGQYMVVVGNDKVEEIYDLIIAETGVAAGGEVPEDDGAPKSIGAMLIDLISGIFQPVLGMLSAAGIMKGLLALITNFFPDFANNGAYIVLYTVADGFFYYLPVILGYTAAKKFRMSEFTGLAIAFALVYPDAVSGLSSSAGDALGTISLGFLGDFSWYATFLGIPIIYPASGYTGGVIPVILMVAFGAQVEKWCKKWVPGNVKMFFVPLITATVAIVCGYLVIGPVATVITNILSSIFQLIFNIPVVGNVLGTTLVGAFWMVLVMFGFHWSLVPLKYINLNTLGYDYLLVGMLPHSFSLGAVLFAMYLKNKDENFRGIAMPAMISSFFFGITEPAIYGVALPDKKAFVVACIGSACGACFLGLTGVVCYLTGGLGVFTWLNYINPDGGGLGGMALAIAGSMIGAAVGFIIEWFTYKAPEQQAA